MIEICKQHVKANLLKSETTALPSCTQYVLSSDTEINEEKKKGATEIVKVCPLASRLEVHFSLEEKNIFCL